jgi:hypothetical protein
VAVIVKGLTARRSKVSSRSTVAAGEAAELVAAEMQFRRVEDGGMTPAYQLTWYW